MARALHHARQDQHRTARPNTQERLFRKAMEAGGVGLWDWDLRTGQAYFDAAWKSQLGFSENELPNEVHAWHGRVHPDDLVRLLRFAATPSVSPLHDALRLEYRVCHKDGSYRQVLCLAAAERDERGRALRLVGSHQVLTEVRVAEEALARQRGQLFACIEHCPFPLAMFDTEMRYLAASAKWRRHYGLSTSIIGRSHYEVFPDLPERWKEVHRRCLEGDCASTAEDRFQRADGTIEWLRWEVHPWRTGSDQVGGIVIFAETLTEKKHAEAILRKSEERLRLAIRGAKLGTWHWNLQTNEIEASDENLAMLGYPADIPLTYERYLECIHPDDRERVRRVIQEACENRCEYEVEFRCQRPDGNTAWLSSRGRVSPPGEGVAPMMEGVALDITSRKEAERVLRESEAQLRSLADAVPHLVSQIAPNGRYIYTNKRWLDYFQRETPGDPSVTAPAMWITAIHPEDAQRITGAWNRILSGEEGEATYEIRVRSRSGEYRWFTARAVPVFDGSGKLLYVIATATDIEDLKRVEEALRESEQRLHAALRAGGIGTSVWEIRENRMVWDAPLLELFGRTREEIERGGLAACMALVHPEDRAHTSQVLTDLLRAGEELSLELRVLRADGEWMWISVKGRLERDADGRPLRLTKAVVDMTRHHQLEEELRQAQKLEGIGQLAGGVAHDFNNILTIILAHASLLVSRRELPAPIATSAREIERAAERAAGLTAQLLAFGRRTMMQPQPMDLNQTVQDALRLLTPMVGENVVLQFEPTPTPIVVFADANMLTQVLLNLALNARDSMPHGGRLHIRNSLEQLDEARAAAIPGASPGKWATLTLSDSGSGIEADVLPHVFEPFFTTKGVGQGSGLGLSTVYGIVKQHRGVVTVDSQVGRGSTFRVMLPVAESRAAVRRSHPPHDATRSGQGNTVLLVEDEPGVRAVLAQCLESQGYSVLQASDGVEAVQISGAHQGPIDLLLSDVVMPGGLSGLQVAERIRVQRPSIKTILSSGHSKDIVAAGIQSGEAGLNFLQKPYSTTQLLAAVQGALEE